MITVRVIEPPVLHGTENVLPKKTTARDNDTETEMSSRDGTDQFVQQEGERRCFARLKADFTQFNKTFYHQ